MAFATMSCHHPVGAAQLLKHAARRQSEIQGAGQGAQSGRPDHGRDEEIGRWYPFNDGVDPDGAACTKADIKLMFKNAKIRAPRCDCRRSTWLDQITPPEGIFNLTVTARNI